MITFHGYEQHPDAFDERPWWRRDGHPLAWKRTDGRRFNGGSASLAAINAEHPLPPPPPRVNQVWVWPDGVEQAIARVDAESVWWPPTARQAPGMFPFDVVSRSEWPPRGAVLVKGDGAPWAPA